MSCFECKYGPTACERYAVEGHTMLCQVSKADTFNYETNENNYHSFLKNPKILEQTMNKTLNELKEMFEDDTTEIQSKRP